MANKTLLLIYLLLGTYTIVNSQNYIYHGENQFESTSTWDVRMNTTFWSGDPELTIAKKNSNQGYLMIFIEVPSKEFYINGILILFLSDGSTIKLENVEANDHVDRKSLALYIIDDKNLLLLKSNRISKIRFSISGGTSDLDSYTADNRRSHIILFDNKENFYNTNTEIKKLFH